MKLSYTVFFAYLLRHIREVICFLKDNEHSNYLICILSTFSFQSYLRIFSFLFIYLFGGIHDSQFIQYRESLLLYIISLFIQSFIPSQFNFTLSIIITYIQFNSDVACLVCAPGPAVDCISHLCYKKNWIFQAEEFTI